MPRCVLRLEQRFRRDGYTEQRGSGREIVKKVEDVVAVTWSSVRCTAIPKLQTLV